MTRLLLFLVLAGVCVGWAIWTYTRAELPVAGARALAALRATVLLLVLALLFDPSLPWGGAGTDGARWVLLDTSLSMDVTYGGVVPSEAARARADALRGEGWRVVPFGDGLAQDSAAPASRTALAEALTRAAEGGAREVRVLSDLRFHDPVEVEAVLDQVPMSVAFERFGGAIRNAGVTRLDVPDVVRRDVPREASVELFAEAGAAGGAGAVDSLVVRIREEGRLVATRTVPAPAPGRRTSAAVTLPPPEAEGQLRYVAEVGIAGGDAGQGGEGGDAFAEDDVAVAYAGAGFDEDAVVLVSLAPDWEPRYLLPVLGQVTGLPTAGFLRVGPDAFLPMGRALERGTAVDSAAVREAASRAALLVLHGLEGSEEGWGRSLAGLAPRRLLWPRDRAGAQALGVEVAPPQGGEWYASSDVPPSPVAGTLAGLDFDALPPLGELFLVADWVGVAPPLQVRLGGSGRAEAAVILDRQGGARRVIPLTQGYWRWAAREGEPREAYRRLWAALAGWLLQDDAGLQVAEVRPEAPVVSRGEATRWRIPGEAEDSVRLELRDSTDAVVAEAVLPGGGTAVGPELGPGPYRWSATDLAGEAAGSGRLDVARTTDELLPPPIEPDAPEVTTRQAGFQGGGDLRTMVWPYALVILLLCLEWIGRRRVGLR